MSAVYKYEPNFPLADKIQFTEFIDAVKKEEKKIYRQFISEYNSRDEKITVSAFTTSNELVDVVLEYLGKGENGIVYKVTVDDVSYVLKIILNHYVSEKPLTEEIEVLKALKGKWFALQLLASSAIRTRDSNGDAVFHIFMLYPYIEGHTLDKWNDHVKQNTSELVQKLKLILEGLNELHKMELVHYDIKGDNIWIPTNPDIPPFFIDFGLSGEFTEKRTPSANYEQLYYTVRGFRGLSPEFLRALGKKNVTYNQIKNMEFSVKEGGKRSRGTKRAKRTKKKRFTQKK